MGFAGLASNAGIERALLGTASGALSWGPSLFRALLAAHGFVLVLVGIVSSSRPRTEVVSRIGGAESSARTGGRRHVWPWALLSVLSGVALALRLWTLNSCLWFDEVLTLVDFVRAPLGEIVTRFPSQNQHMLFSILAHGSIAAFGESAWALRLPSVAFGIASLWALFLLARRIVGEHEALLACALMTVSYHHVWFSQNARGYMGLLFFATLSTWLWFEALDRRSWSWHVAYAVAVALGMWTHLTMVFVPIAHVMAYAIHVVRRAWRTAAWSEVPLLAKAGPGEAPVRRPPVVAFRQGQARLGAARGASNIWAAIVGWVLAGSLTLQLYALSLPEFLRTGLHEVSLQSEWTSPFWVISESLRSLQIGFGALAVVLCGLLVASAGWLNLARRSWMAAATLILPPLLGGAVMSALGHNLWPRFFFFAMGFAVLIAVHGAMTVPRLLLLPFPSLRSRESIAAAAGTAALLLMITASACTLPRAYALPKQDFTGARDYVASARRDEDAVVAVGLAGVAYSRYFAPRWQNVESAAELEAALRFHPHVWLVYTLPVELKAYHPAVWDVVDREFEVVKVFAGTLGGGDVTVCRERSNGKLAWDESSGAVPR
jgi:hypothetical protein